MLTEISASSPDLVAALTAEDLPVSDLAKSGRRFWTLSVEGESVGFVGLETGGSSALLRSLVVAENQMGKGYGKTLVMGALEQARLMGLTELWLLTRTAKPFFERLGWKVRNRADAPAEIAKSEEFTSLCPASAVCMKLAVPQAQ